MTLQPSGTVTLLFTDIEGSTRLLQALGGERYREALHQQRRLLREAFDRHAGYEVDSEGDAFFVAFASAPAAVAAAGEAQRALAEAEWPEGKPLRVRMGIHTGEPLLAPPKYVGLDVHQAARIMSAGHGGQVLVSQATRALLGEEFALRDLGEHRLKDLTAAQRLFQLELPGLPRTFPPLRTLEGRATNLPAQPSALIGRESELALLQAQLREPGVRLLTLTGPGGTGKTRLALQLAAELIDDFADGVFCTFLAPLADPALVPATILSTLGLRDQTGESAEETLAAYLADKQLLLLLDNLEHLLRAAPALGSLLARAPQLTLLVTSRAPLRLQAEREYPLDPLAPEEAQSLFLERARAVRPDFSPSGEEQQAIAAICLRLDGLPLAIELAAARVRSLPASAILSRLEQRLKLLTGGARDLPERQRTLRGAIEWSYELLDAEERALYRRLSVFAGDLSLAAAEAVCDREGLLDVLDGLDSLVEKSLLRSGREIAGEPRYFLLETIREHAAEKLEQAGEQEALRRQHCEYFVGLAEEAARKFIGPEQAQWLEKLDAEPQNVRSALQWALDAGELELLLRLASAFTRYWDRQAMWKEALVWLRAGLARSDAVRSEIRALALYMAGNAADRTRDAPAAESLLEDALALYRQLGDERGQARTLNGRAWLAGI